MFPSILSLVQFSELGFSHWDINKCDMSKACRTPNYQSQHLWFSRTFSIKKMNIYICIYMYLFACGMWDLHSSLQHTGSLVAIFKLLVVTHGTQFPDQGQNLSPMHWEHGVLATRSRGKSLGLFLIIKIWLQIHNGYRNHIFIQSRKERYRQCQQELLLLGKKKKIFPTTFEQTFLCSSLTRSVSCGHPQQQGSLESEIRSFPRLCSSIWQADRSLGEVVGLAKQQSLLQNLIIDLISLLIPQRHAMWRHEDIN